LAADASENQDIDESISGINQLLATMQRSLPANDANGAHLSAKLQQRRTELRRDNLARKSVALAIDHAQKGQINEAVASFAEALALVVDDPEEPPLDIEEKAKLRGQTLEWFKGELTAWAKLVESAPPQDRLSIGQALRRWQQGSNLAGHHVAEGLAKLPAAEQRAFSQFWAHAAQLLTKAEGGIREVPAAEQVEEVRAELKKRNPSFDGSMTYKADGRVVTELNIDSKDVKDPWPLRALVGLKSLSYNGGPLSDLSPLKGMNLTSLNLGGCTRVQDLSPLKGMPLNSLDLHVCRQIKDLTPLKGMKLTFLNLHDGPQVDDLTPLIGMPLTLLRVSSDEVRDLTPLKGMPLTELSLSHCRQVHDISPLKGLKPTVLLLEDTQVRDLEPLKDMPLKKLYIHASGVTDVTPLQALQLEDIRLTPNNITQGLETLRAMKSLTTIGLTHYQSWPAAEFWARHDKGEFKK
jgi:hypothetical protein